MLSDFGRRAAVQHFALDQQSLVERSSEFGSPSASWRSFTGVLGLEAVEPQRSQLSSELWSPPGKIRLQGFGVTIIEV